MTTECRHQRGTKKPLTFMLCSYVPGCRRGHCTSSVTSLGTTGAFVGSGTNFLEGAESTSYGCIRNFLPIQGRIGSRNLLTLRTTTERYLRTWASVTSFIGNGKKCPPKGSCARLAKSDTLLKVFFYLRTRSRHARCPLLKYESASNRTKGTHHDSRKH